MAESVVAAAARRALGAPGARIDRVHREPVPYDAFMAGRTLSRLRGTALVDGGSRPWSMIEKRTEGPATASTYLYENARREFLAYRSGLLLDLTPGVRAAAVHGLEERPDGSLILWLEDLGQASVPGDAASILAAARDLGRLAGTFIDRVPALPWLFGGWIARHSQPEVIERDLARLGSVRDPGMIARRVGSGIPAAEALMREQDRLRAMLEALPVTLCHHDAVAANVFRTSHGANHDLVLIDWEMVGPGPVGADLVSLLFSSARRGDTPARSVPELIGPALEAYGQGIVQAGGRVDADLLRRSFHAGVALRWALARDVMLALDAGTAVRRGSAPEEAPHAALEELILLTGVLFDSARAVGVLEGRS